ncbi:transcription elongation factor NusA protein [Marine Group I thaumarchaeote SCGC AAA799-E16]|uniref:Transcription elongation factor NusA protein n=5 Tax=Marine Group I TaxID=905826 RepID=A0A087S5T4_9ARCH|nr:transcription elongation factor NusA protein [Marine Group I thaumarchaeote SCGC AAA799-N04]KER06599.1 transcription elongation factor NusA protein [Marine Group I thaumarchaeote SCGC AAA799-E16]KFM16088.1 transcription elongation factor NusA protein [Marine Group I thaumarchaeote SCGC AAA799-D11]KFM17825.1 transcription elongation factor NusA protein [Marine Group I thaumarchaeote SCGC RSA3]KFM21088.1 transcription elongation factor NusA protein [Marine Group I thaumarchaeote SCGC AAA799-B0
MKLPICGFDAKNAILCPQCEGKVESGELTQADVDASIVLAKVAKSNSEIENFTLYSCKEFQGNFVLYLAKNDIMIIRQSRTLYRLLQDQFKGKIWLVEADETDKKFIEDLFFPTKILSINSVWAPGGVQKTKAVVSGKWTPKFPIDTEKVIEIVKNARNLDIEIEFEDKGRK